MSISNNSINDGDDLTPAENEGKCLEKGKL